MSNIPPQRPGLVLHATHPNDGGPPAGRPPNKYSKELHKEIVDHLLSGHSPDNVAQACGISKTTFWKWVNMGRSGDPWLMDFAQDVDAAIGASLMRHEKVVIEQSRSDPKFALSVLERRDPNQWAKINQSQQMAEIMARFLSACEAHFPAAIYADILAIAAGAGSPQGILPAHEEDAENE